MTGGSDDSYVRHMLISARSKGWRVVVFNSRGCGESPVTTPQVLTLAHESNAFLCYSELELCFFVFWFRASLQGMVYKGQIDGFLWGSEVLSNAGSFESNKPKH